MGSNYFQILWAPKESDHNRLIYLATQISLSRVKVYNSTVLYYDNLHLNLNTIIGKNNCFFFFVTLCSIQHNCPSQLDFQSIWLSGNHSILLSGYLAIRLSCYQAIWLSISGYQAIGL